VEEEQQNEGTPRLTYRGQLEDSVSAGFTCELLDTDLPYYFGKGYAGIIVYVRLLSGTLPAITSNVLIDESADLRGRPAKAPFPLFLRS
jgi:hypothetical protein